MELLDTKTDNRGSLLKFKLGKKKFLIVLTKKGFLRGGETHNMPQRTILAEGKIEVVTKLLIANSKGIYQNVDITNTYKGVQEFFIPPNTPHYFRFLEDSVIMEYEDENMTREYYPEYRKIVEESMK